MARQEIVTNIGPQMGRASLTPSRMDPMVGVTSRASNSVISVLGEVMSNRTASQTALAREQRKLSREAGRAAEFQTILGDMKSSTVAEVERHFALAEAGTPQSAELLNFRIKQSSTDAILTADPRNLTVEDMKSALAHMENLGKTASEKTYQVNGYSTVVDNLTGDARMLIPPAEQMALAEAEMLSLRGNKAKAGMLALEEKFDNMPGPPNQQEANEHAKLRDIYQDELNFAHKVARYEKQAALQRYDIAALDHVIKAGEWTQQENARHFQTNALPILQESMSQMISFWSNPANRPDQTTMEAELRGNVTEFFAQEGVMKGMIASGLTAQQVMDGYEPVIKAYIDLANAMEGSDERRLTKEAKLYELKVKILEGKWKTSLSPADMAMNLTIEQLRGVNPIAYTIFSSMASDLGFPADSYGGMMSGERLRALGKIDRITDENAIKALDSNDPEAPAKLMEVFIRSTNDFLSGREPEQVVLYDSYFQVADALYDDLPDAIKSKVDIIRYRAYEDK